MEEALPVPSTGPRSPSPFLEQRDIEAEVKARKKNSFVVFGEQLGVMLRRNFILMYRHRIATLAQMIIAPVIFLLILYILQVASNNKRSQSNYNPEEYPLELVQPCQGYTMSSPCINLLYTPDTPQTRQILSIFDNTNAARLQAEGIDAKPWGFHNVNGNLSTSQAPDGQWGMVPVADAQTIYDYVLANPNTTMYGIELNILPGNVTNYRYQLWFNVTSTANSTDAFGAQLLALERGLDEAIITYANDPTVTTTSTTTFNIRLKDWPVVPPTQEDQNIVTSTGAMFFFCSNMIIFINILNTIVSEKEAKLTHSLVMFGLKKEVYWISHFLSNAVIVVICSLVTVGIGIGMGFEVFKNANFGAMFLTFFLFGISMNCFAFFITVFCKRSRVAVLIGIFMFVIGLLFQSFAFNSNYTGYIWWDSHTNKAGWIVLVFFPFFNFGKVFLDISEYTAGMVDQLTNTAIPGPGFAWSNLYDKIPSNYLPVYDTSGRKPDVPAPIQSWYFMLMDLAVYALLTWYLDKIIPDEFGQCRHPLFFLFPSTYGIKLKRGRLALDDWLARVQKKTGGPMPLEDDDDDVARERDAAFDPEIEPALRISNLRRVYRQSIFRRSKLDKVAVDDLCLTMPEGKLLALLGQNGAGKSTAMNILSGLNPATAGDALLYGLSVRKDMDSIRTIMGVCPQHDVLFTEMTAKEHVELYAGIKGVPSHQIKQLTKERLKAVRLWKVKDKLCGQYSGGMKRRLSVVIATLGDPRIVFLDEPTTGMDPVNRRHVWSFLEQFKRGRVVVLTTHSMEEADVLSDRICVMAHGRLRALGNSIHLKNKFGAGYRVSLVTTPSDSEDVKSMVMAQIPDAMLEDDSAGGLIYQFPLTSMPHIPTFVQWLEDKQDGSERIKAWGISQTTLEEVFLRLIRDANPGGYSGYDPTKSADPVAEKGPLRRRRFKKN